MTRLPLRLILWATTAGLLVSCQGGNNLPALGDHTVTLWSGDTIAFVPGRPVAVEHAVPRKSTGSGYTRHFLTLYV